MVDQETAEAVTIGQCEYDRLQETVRQQREEIEALEYRVKTLLENA